jgi:hypothetical protein
MEDNPRFCFDDEIDPEMQEEISEVSDLLPEEHPSYNTNVDIELEAFKDLNLEDEEVKFIIPEDEDSKQIESLEEVEGTHIQLSTGEDTESSISQNPRGRPKKNKDYTIEEISSIIKAQLIEDLHKIEKAIEGESPHFSPDPNFVLLIRHG